MVQPAVRVKSTFFEYLVDEAGSTDMNVDGSGTSVEFRFITPRPVLVYRLNIAVVGGAKEVLDGFFSLGILTKGLTIIHRKSQPQGGGTIHHFGTATVPIRRHNDFGALAGIDVDSDTVANMSRFTIRWTLERAGLPHQLNQFEELVINIRDDLSTLTSMRAMVQGF